MSCCAARRGTLRLCTAGDGACPTSKRELSPLSRALCVHSAAAIIMAQQQHAVASPTTPGNASQLRWLTFRCGNDTFECPSVYSLVKPIGKGGAPPPRDAPEAAGPPPAARRHRRPTLRPPASLPPSPCSLWHRVRGHRRPHPAAGGHQEDRRHLHKPTRRPAHAPRGPGAVLRVAVWRSSLGGCMPCPTHRFLKHTLPPHTAAAAPCRFCGTCAVTATSSR